MNRYQQRNPLQLSPKQRFQLLAYEQEPGPTKPVADVSLWGLGSLLQSCGVGGTTHILRIALLSLYWRYEGVVASFGLALCSLRV